MRISINALVITGAVWLSTLLPAAGQADTKLTGMKLGNFEAAIIPIHPKGQMSPELNGVLDGMDPATKSEIQTAVLAGDLRIGRVELGSKSFGVSDKDTIGLKVGQDGRLVDRVALKHEWGHVQNAIAAGTDLDPTVGPPCGHSTHAGMTVDSMNDLCESIAASTDPDEKNEGCKDFETVSDAAKKQVAAATQAAPGCPNAPAVPTVPTCPACS